MRKSVLLIAALAVVAASCGGGSESASPSSKPTESPVTTSPATTSPPGVDPPTTTVAVVEGPIAPDFTLALGDGGEFTLSAEAKPVYMVFWAEW